MPGIEYKRDGDRVVAVVRPGTVRTRYEQTALDDHQVELTAGEYLLEPVTIDWRPTTFEAAYWFRADIPAVRVSDGARFGKRGDRVTYQHRPYGYSIRTGRSR